MTASYHRVLRLVAMLATIALITAIGPGAAPTPAPEVPGENGKRAYDDLAALYGDEHRQPDVTGALGRLKSPDPEARKAAGQYLLALFRQSLADEKNGRAEWKQLPFFGGGSESAAREFRKHAAEQFGTDAVSDEALDAALWLIEQDPLAQDQAAGVKMLRRDHSPAAVEIFRKLLSPPHHNAEVVVELLDEVAARKQSELADLVKPLCNHYRTRVRESARKTAAALGLPQLPPFRPEEAFTPWLEGELRAIGQMVLTNIPADAKWRRFSVTEKGAQRPEEFSGWLLSEAGDSYSVLDLFGRERTLAKAETKVSDRAMKEDADYYLKVRAEKDPNDPFKAMEALSERGGLTGQFQPGFVSLPESLLAAWAFTRGDKATAAAVIFPRLDDAEDERWIRMVARDLLGWHYHDELLHAFCSERDYPEAIRFAEHLSRPAFNDYQYQDRAKELAKQLAARGDDFKKLALPTPQHWAEMKKTLTRPQQVAYLAERLRLLNCFQWGQPGGVNFDDPQYDRPGMRGNPADETGEKPRQVVNPYSELEAMKLEVKDLPPLLPRLADEDFIPTYSYWRDFHPGRTMYRVNALVAEIVNAAAKRDLADLKTYESLDPEGKKRHLEQIARWVEVNGGKSGSDLLLETLTAAKDWREFDAAAVELIQNKEKRAMPIVTKRLNDFPQQSGEVAELCYRLSAANFVDQARQWIKSGDKDARFWGAMILLHAGDRKKLEGLDAMKPILDQDDGTLYYPRAFDELLANGREEAIQLACGVLAKQHRGNFALGAMVHRLVLAGRQEAVDYVTAALDSAEASGSSSGQYQGKQVERQQVAGDSAAQMIAGWRTDKYDYPSLAPDADRAVERTRLKLWFLEQVKLRKEGKKSGLREEPEPLQAAQWRLDAP